MEKKGYEENEYEQNRYEDKMFEENAYQQSGSTFILYVIKYSLLNNINCLINTQ